MNSLYLPAVGGNLSIEFLIYDPIKQNEIQKYENITIEFECEGQSYKCEKVVQNNQIKLENKVELKSINLFDKDIIFKLFLRD